MKVSVRKGLAWTQLTILLSLAVDFSVIGVTVWYVSVQQASALGDEYVTIAVPREQEMDN